MPKNTPQYWLINFQDNSKYFYSHDGLNMRIGKEFVEKLFCSSLIENFKTFFTM
jgi:hypothetical protein